MSRAERRAPSRRRLRSLAFGFLMAAAPAVAAPSGYFIDWTAARASRPAHVEEATGDFTVSIRRGYPDPLAGRLLAMAEAVYPPRDLLVQMAQEMVSEMGSDTARTPLWWCQGVGARRVPYAITAGALEHYVGLTEQFRRRVFRASGGRPLRSSDLIYRATIAHRDSARVSGRSYTDAYVARLELIWTYDDGTFEPFVKAHRIVFLTSEGAILAVEGDGDAEEEISLSSQRGGRRR